MNRTKSLIGKIAFIGLCAVALAGCYYAPAPYAYGPGYAAAPAYYGPPVYGSVVVGGGGWEHGGGGWDHGGGHWR